MKECLFCSIAEGKTPCNKIYEDENAIVFKDINPQAPVHVLVVPKKHIPGLPEANDKELIGQLFILAAEIAKREGVSLSGYRTVINTNRDGGQTVSHLHIHILGGRKMEWPPG